MINKFMNIWCFGDSWTWGAELWDENIMPLSDYKEKMKIEDDGTCPWMYIPENREYIINHRWSGILEKDYGYTVTNFGENGASNNQILERLIHALENENSFPDLIIISWTTQYRYTERVDNWKEKEDSFSKHQSHPTPNYSDCVFEDNFFHIVNTAFSVAHEHNLPILNINAFYKNKICNKFPKHIDFAEQTLLSACTNQTITDISKIDWHMVFSESNNKDEKWLRPMGHPNEQGHKLIAKYINEVITNENI